MTGRAPPHDALSQLTSLNGGLVDWKRLHACHLGGSKATQGASQRGTGIARFVGMPPRTHRLEPNLEQHARFSRLEPSGATPFSRLEPNLEQHTRLFPDLSRAEQHFFPDFTTRQDTTRYHKTRHDTTRRDTILNDSAEDRKSLPPPTWVLLGFFFGF
jgi:hypothetical protein